MTADLTADLDRLEGLAGKATEGPWVTDTHVGGDGWVVMAGGFRRAHFPRFGRGAEDVDNQRADAEFAAEACTNAPALAAVVRAVLAVHVPVYASSSDEAWNRQPICGACSDERDTFWPCATVQAAETAWEARG